MLRKKFWDKKLFSFVTSTRVCHKKLIQIRLKGEYLGGGWVVVYDAIVPGASFDPRPGDALM